MLTGGGWAPGIAGSALYLNGSDQYAVVPDDASLDIADEITMMAWVKAEELDTQYLIKKAIHGSVDGYELSLAAASASMPGGDRRAFTRFNQASRSNDYRVNSTTEYPYDPSAWIHLTATYDGTTTRVYVNGAEESASDTGLTAIALNDLPLVIGAGSDGNRPFQGALDEVRIYNRALTAEEIADLFNPTAIELLSFSAEAQGRAVTVAWETAVELDNAGFNLYRAGSADGARTQLNAQLIASQAAFGGGASYSFRDRPGTGTFTYWLEAVDHDGARTLHGPVQVQTGRPGLLELKPSLTRDR
jgi:hypothetical protein